MGYGRVFRTNDWAIKCTTNLAGGSRVVIDGVDLVNPNFRDLGPVGQAKVNGLSWGNSIDRHFDPDPGPRHTLQSNRDTRGIGLLGCSALGSTLIQQDGCI
jgi:hypothetical protein